MVQRHSIILWRKAEKADKNFEEISKDAYDVLSIFQEYPYDLRPNYLTSKNPKDIKQFSWNYENFSRTLKKGSIKEDERLFEDLGYSISFYSSADVLNSCAFQMRVGNKNKRFNNVLIIDLPISLNLYDKETAEMIKNLFIELVLAFVPYWGCVSNKALSRKYGKYLEGNLPTTARWMSYWSEEIVREVGMERIKKLVAQNPGVSFQKGILLTKDTGYDLDKAEDVVFYEKIQKSLFTDVSQS